MGRVLRLRRLDRRCRVGVGKMVVGVLSRGGNLEEYAVSIGRLGVHTVIAVSKAPAVIHQGRHRYISRSTYYIYQHLNIYKQPIIFFW